MTDNKGFTLVELMIVLVILTLIMVISVPTFSNIMGNAETNTYASSGEMIEKAATMASVSEGRKDSFTVGELKDKGYLDVDIPVNHGNITITDESTVDLKGSRYIYRGDYVQDGLVLHYDFSGYNNQTLNKIKDLSAKGNDGTLVGFNGSVTSGFTGQGLRFDGSDDYINVPGNSPSKDLTWSVTVAPHEHKDTMLISSNDGAAYLRMENAMLAGAVRGDNGAVKYTKTGYRVALNEPVVLTFVKDGNAYSFYANGERISGKSGLSQDYDYTVRNIGRYLGDGKRNTNGTFYAVRAYNRALSPDEVKQNVNVDKAKFGVTTNGE